ncbi:MAG: Gfo/Idh/MocA family oxidoreductase [Trueperaceae bacterium]|nr:Gfo/Idh/MocA family oxidoreductase [Trueperaceae bacterium]
MAGEKRDVGIGVVGCGTISSAYLRNLTKAAGVRVVALADIDVDRASARATEFGVPLATDPDSLLDLPDVDLVIDLTIPAAHYDVNSRALLAGKAVYSEKPLSVDAGSANALLNQATGLGLALGGAPDTFLGAGQQTAAAALDAGVIGAPFAAVAHMVSRGPESWHHSPEFLFQPGAGPLYDIGPYYVTALVNFFGPVKSVTASATRGFQTRTIGSGPRAGTSFDVGTDTHTTLLLEFVSGVHATLLTSFDVSASDLPRFEVFGTTGTLAVPDPNTFGGPVRVRRSRDTDWEDIPLGPGWTENARGIGALELALATSQGRPARASGALAAHVIEVLDGAVRAAADGQRQDISSRPQRPARLSQDEHMALGWKPEVAP